MAQGPCGEDFKAAFSCFVHSEQEPKGVDCVEKFKAMQDCFRKHPDVYGEGESRDRPLPLQRHFARRGFPQAKSIDRLTRPDPIPLDPPIRDRGG